MDRSEAIAIDRLESPSRLGQADKAPAPATSPIAPVAETAEALSPRVSSLSRDAWRRFRRNRAAMVSLALLLLITLMAIFAPFLHTTNPIALDVFHQSAPPSPQHWMGTDGLGEDMYSRILYGLRVPLSVGFIGTFITVIVGTLIGVSAAYYGGWFDDLMCRFTDLMFAFPALLLTILVISLFGQAFNNTPFLGVYGRLLLTISVFAFVSWPGLMRFVRSLGLSLKEQQFVEAARTSGTSSWGIIVKHLLPNMYGLILVQASLAMVGIIYGAVSLSIFALGIPPPAPDIGQQLFVGVSYLDIDAWQVIFPSIFLCVMLVGLSFIGDGVRDAVDPRMNA